MLTCRITVMRKCHHADLSALYENPIEHACDLIEGQTFISRNAEIPDGFCAAAWLSLQPFVMAMAFSMTLRNCAPSSVTSLLT